MLKKYFLFLFNLFFLCSFSQNIKIDSLKTLLKNPKSDKFNVSNLLAWEYGKVNPDTLHFYNELSKTHIKTELQKGMYLVLKGNFLFLNQDFKKSTEIINQSIAIAKKHDDYNTLGSCYNVLSKIKSIEGDFVESAKLAKTAFVYTFKTKNKQKILKSIINYGSTLIQNNEYEEGIKYYKLGEKYFYKGCEFEQGVLYNNLAQAFVYKSDYINALKYVQIAEKYLFKAKAKVFYFDCFAVYSNVYINLRESEKAEQYLMKALYFSKNELEQSNVYFLYAQLHFNLKNHEKAKEYLQKSITIDSKINQSKLGEDYSLMAEILNATNDFENAEKNLKKAIDIFKINNEEENLKTAYNLLLKNHFQKNNLIDFKNYYSDYTKLSKKIEAKNNTKALFDLDKKYRTAEKESKIKTQQLQIQKEKNNKHIALGSFGLLLFLSGSAYFWFRNKQKQTNLVTQNTLLGLQQNLVAAELSNLNKQLDPHEIKNLLASISPEIQEKAPESYTKMLKLFNLTKASLNSNSITDSLENQLQQIDDFLSLEKSMLSVPLDYSIENTFQNRQTQIPRLLLKNLVENALKHGIKQQETGGAISVKVREKDNFIYIVVDDNGKGRQHSISLDSGIGTTTYKKLFETLNPMNKEKATFEIIDKQQGTKVEVQIPTNYNYK